MLPSESTINADRRWNAEQFAVLVSKPPPIRNLGRQLGQQERHLPSVVTCGANSAGGETGQRPQGDNTATNVATINKPCYAEAAIYYAAVRVELGK